MPLTLETFGALIDARNFDALIGEVENEWFEAKQQPYQLNTEPGKRELAKDVAAFANAGGGVILIGARTVQSSVHYGDEIAEVRPVEQDLVNATQYRNILDGWIYPRLEGVAVNWHATRDDPSRGIVVLLVPAQKDESKPFLVVKSVHGTKVIETMFGYAERRAEGNAPLGVAELQRAMRVGMHYERTMQGRLDGIKALLRAFPPQRESPANLPTSKVAARIDETLTDAGMEAERNLVLVAYPATATELTTLFSSAPTSIRAQVERPPTLRRSGWDIETGAGAEIVRGAMVRSQTWRKTLSLYRDGTLIFACRADDNFLSWTSKINKFHPLALVEVVLTFVLFYEGVLPDLSEQPQTIVFHIGLNNLHKDNEPSRLGPWDHKSMAFMFNDGVRDAPAESFALEISVPAAAFVPERIAYRLVSEVYFWFGFEKDKIPYLTEVSGESRIDRAAVANP